MKNKRVNPRAHQALPVDRMPVVNKKKSCSCDCSVQRIALGSALLERHFESQSHVFRQVLKHKPSCAAATVMRYSVIPAPSL